MFNIQDWARFTIRAKKRTRTGQGLSGSIVNAHVGGGCSGRVVGKLMPKSMPKTGRNKVFLGRFNQCGLWKVRKFWWVLWWFIVGNCYNYYLMRDECYTKIRTRVRFPAPPPIASQLSVRFCRPGIFSSKSWKELKSFPAFFVEFAC